MRIGYNTNGFAHHLLADALRILTQLGYDAVAITVERAHLDPPDRRGVDRCARLIAPLLNATGLRATIETGARYILDPWRKHQPTLLSERAEDRRMRVDFLKAAIEVAGAVNADSVSLWSGASDDDADEAAVWCRLNSSLSVVADHAAAHSVRLAFEPEPGMFIDSMARFSELVERLPHPALGLTIDVGHLMCLDDGRIEEHVSRWSKRLWNVHVEDMRQGVHEHLMFGEGDVNFSVVCSALGRVGYTGPIHVELSRHSHVAVEAARSSIKFLRNALGTNYP